MNLHPWLTAGLGGALIGSAALLLWLGLGRVAGISGIVGGVVAGQRERWRLSFLVGLIGGGAVIPAITGRLWPETVPTSSLPLVAIAGILVGLGTSWGNGCTSGHGICGVARFSKRSLVATCVFMAFGMFSATFLRGWLGGVL